MIFKKWKVIKKDIQHRPQSFTLMCTCMYTHPLYVYTHIQTQAYMYKEMNMYMHMLIKTTGAEEARRSNA